MRSCKEIMRITAINVSGRLAAGAELESRNFQISLQFDSNDLSTTMSMNSTPRSMSELSFHSS